VTRNELMEAIGDDYQKNLIPDDLSPQSSADGDPFQKDKLGINRTNSMTQSPNRRSEMHDTSPNARDSRLTKKEV